MSLYRHGKEVVVHTETQENNAYEAGYLGWAEDLERVITGKTPASIALSKEQPKATPKKQRK